MGLEAGGLQPKAPKLDKTRPNDRQELLAQLKMMKDADYGRAREGQLMDKYTAEPFSDTEGIEQSERERICAAYVGALQELGIVAAINKNADVSRLLFTSASTGRNEMQILTMLDPLLDGKKPTDVRVGLADLTQRPNVLENDGKPAQFQHMTVDAIQMNAMDLDTPELADMRVYAICERLGALWHLTEKDAHNNFAHGTSGSPQLLALLKTYLDKLTPDGYLIVDSNTTSPEAESTWEKIKVTIGQERVDDFLRKNLNVSIKHFTSPDGIRLTALRYNTKAA